MNLRIRSSALAALFILSACCGGGDCLGVAVIEFEPTVTEPGAYRIEITTDEIHQVCETTLPVPSGEKPCEEDSLPGFGTLDVIREDGELADPMACLEYGCIGISGFRERMVVLVPSLLPLLLSPRASSRPRLSADGDSCQFGHVHLKDVGDASETVKRQVSPAVLDDLHVVDGDPRSFRKPFLRELPLPA